MKSQFHTRLQYIARLKKTDQAGIASGLSIDPSTVNRWWKGKVIPREGSVRYLSEFLGCSYEYLATGVGEPFPTAVQKAKAGLNQLNETGISPLGALGRIQDRSDQEEEASSNLADQVPVVYIEDTYASAGGGIINYEAARRVMTFDRGFLAAELGIHQFNNIHVIHAVGDSMEPTIHPGDLLFINPGEKEIVTGAVYVFLIGEETMVKRIERNPITAELTLRSDNNQYEPVRIDKENLSKVQVIGRVIGNFRKF